MPTVDIAADLFLPQFFATVEIITGTTLPKARPAIANEVITTIAS